MGGIRLLRASNMYCCTVVLFLAILQHANATCGYTTCFDMPLYMCSLDYCTMNTELQLADRSLTGTIPENVLTLSNLVTFNAANNSLSGPLPLTIQQMKALHILELSGNSLTGPIPSELGSANLLTHVNLLGNEFAGYIPASLGSLSRLQLLDVSQNRLHGIIPASICQLEGAGIDLEFNNVKFTTKTAINPIYLQYDYMTFYFVPWLTGNYYDYNTWKGQSSTFSTYYSNLVEKFNSCTWCEEVCHEYGYFASTSDYTSTHATYFACGTQVFDAASSVECFINVGSATQLLPSDTYRCSEKSIFVSTVDSESPSAAYSFHYNLTVDTASIVNVKEELKLQQFSCPLPSSCGAWLQDDCGAGVCAVDYADLEQINVSISALESAQRTVLTDVHAMDTEVASYSAELDEQATEIAALQAALASVSASVIDITAETATQKSAADAQKSVVDNLLTDVGGLQVAMEDSDITMNSLAATVTSLQSQLAEQQTLLFAQAAANKNLTVASDMQRAQISELQAQMTLVLDALEASSNATTLPANFVSPSVTHDSVDDTEMSSTTSVTSCAVNCDDEALPGSDASAIGGAVAGVLLVLVGAGAAVAVYLHRKRRIGNRFAVSKKAKAVAIPLMEVVDGAVDTVGSITTLLADDTTVWPTVQRIAEKMLHYRKNLQSSGDTPSVIEQAKLVLATSLAENQILRDFAAQSKDFATAAIYAERVHLLEAVLGVAEPTESPMECVAPGLLLQKDRFQKTSDAFLGKGAWSFVSKGVLVDGEVRRLVAVKEIAKSSGYSEGRAVQEVNLMSKLQHTNIVHVYNVKLSSSGLFLVMEQCAFAMDNQPTEFAQFLHASEHVSKLVLNALIQDLIRGCSFLHSRSVAHCDIKVRRSRCCCCCCWFCCWFLGLFLFTSLYRGLLPCVARMCSRSLPMFCVRSTVAGQPGEERPAKQTQSFSSTRS